MKRSVTRKSGARPDPFEHEIEMALNPGVFIPDRACFSFASNIEDVAGRIAGLITGDPTRAMTLYETFLAACNEKAGLTGEWEKTVSQVRADHHRKYRFMAGFEKLAAGSGPSHEPSFLERAKARWGRQRTENG